MNIESKMGNIQNFFRTRIKRQNWGKEREIVITLHLVATRERLFCANSGHSYTQKPGTRPD